MKPAVLCWSGGKDSAYALYTVLKEKEYEVKYLLTTISDETQRVSMHGVREELINRQCVSIGIPLIKMIVKGSTNEMYETAFMEMLNKMKEEGIDHVIFGDIFLEDLRKYRENLVSRVGMKCIFPLWKIDSKKLIHDFLHAGFKTITCCVDERVLSKAWAGREVDRDFIRELPPAVDPCGENGEFHTFCFDGPVFRKEIEFEKGELIYKSYPSSTNTPATEHGFWFCDLIPVTSQS